jgi:hypothetical protein
MRTRPTTAENLYDALVEAQRIGGDPLLCEALRLLCERTGQNKFRNAAAIIGGSRLGRAALDDSEALRRIAAFPPDRRRDAVAIVAGQAGGGDAAKVHAIAQRLRRKLRKNAVK